MPTTNERKALWFLALVATSGTAVRLWRSPRDQAVVATAALENQMRRVDSVRLAHSAAAAAPRNRRYAAAPVVAPDVSPRTPTPAGPVDLDRAAAPEIEGLPGISGPVALRIVANRDSLGPFGSLDALCRRVRGVGPATARRLRPLVTFSAAAKP